MVDATGRKDRSTGWPDGLEGQVAAVKLGLSTGARGELGFCPGAAYDIRKGLYPPVESTGGRQHPWDES